MNKKDLFNSFNGVNEKWLMEAENFEKERKKNKVYPFITIAATVAIIIISVLVINLTSDKPSLGITEGSSLYTTIPDSTVTQAFEVTVATEESTASSTAPGVEVTTNIAEETISDGSFGSSSYIPAVPLDKTIKAINTENKITDEEASVYFELNLPSIISALSAFGENTDKIVLKENGYCHISFNGKENESFQLKENFRDYLLYNGDDIIAIITLFKENGEIYNTPSFGSPAFKSYAEYLANHKGQKLLYVYQGPIELIIAPDNSIYTFNFDDNFTYLKGLDNAYSVIYNDRAIYIP